MRAPGKAGNLVLMILVLVLIPLVACSSDDEEAPTPAATEAGNKESVVQTEIPLAPTPAEDVAITIGNLTDLTGVAAQTCSTVTLALEDLIRADPEWQPIVVAP